MVVPVTDEIALHVRFEPWSGVNYQVVESLNALLAGSVQALDVLLQVLGLRGRRHQSFSGVNPFQILTALSCVVAKS